MAATTTTHLKIQTHQPTSNTKTKRRRFRETTISATATAAAATTTESHSHQRKLDSAAVVSPDNSWCCATSKPPPPPHIAPDNAEPVSGSPSDLKIRYSPTASPQAMESSSALHAYAHAAAAGIYGGANGDSFPSSFSKFNSVLTAGLLNPMSPPPSVEKTRSSPTLFEMMASEPDCPPRTQIAAPNVAVPAPKSQISAQDRQALMQQRLSYLLACRSPGSQFNDAVSGDVKLTLSSKEGLSILMNLHQQILVAHSRFFAMKLSDLWSRPQRAPGPYIVEIADCDDIEVYIETLRLMYCKDLRRRLMKEDVSRVLGILKVSAAIGFEAGVLSCLEYLEAAPWAEDEEEKVAALLSELQLEGVGTGEVLKRVSGDVPAGIEERNENEEVLLRLLQVVLEGKDEKARREMKGLVTKMLRENSSQNELRKESLYSACDGCLQLLRQHFLKAADADLQEVGQIARQADNLHWILDILIDRQIAEEFLKTWASQSELSDAHSKVPAIHRYEVSRVTARLFVGIGKGQLLASKDARCLLLRTWLGPFYDDFGWMRRASNGLDRHLIEDGLSNTILTLPLSWQQEILMSWFDRFLNSGDDCPNIQRGFEIWWRRAFWRRNGGSERPQQMRITTASIEN
ncbi:BTB/POZ domain-containing protein At1g63850 [Diospyros lotus]|uniref:BTB/POZ domain-containing protein At1g63850 n=1 Tax=Diospyros lotus TaxID=55363 RepID=UPI002258BF97|nr:BTB/POZ domain-containing protein At1g63850 [Diospyros lotus]